MNSLSIDSMSAVLAAPRHRILIIDDNTFFSFCLRTLIDRDPQLRVCDVAANDAAVLDRIAHCQPDLLVIDLSVGRAGGYGLANALRAQGVVQPILFISSGPSLSREQLRRLPDSAFAFKGLNPNQLILRIKKMLKVRNASVAAPVAAIA